jgi:hypothetical protein
MRIAYPNGGDGFNRARRESVARVFTEVDEKRRPRHLAVREQTPKMSLHPGTRDHRPASE